MTSNQQIGDANCGFNVEFCLDHNCNTSQLSQRQPLSMGTVAVRSIFRNGTHSLARPAVTTTFTQSRLAKYVDLMLCHRST